MYSSYSFCLTTRVQQIKKCRLKIPLKSPQICTNNSKTPPKKAEYNFKNGKLPPKLKKFLMRKKSLLCLHLPPE